MRPILLLGAGTLSLAALVLSSMLLTGASSAQSTTNIEVDDFYFCDSSHQGNICDTTVNAGDTVTWTNMAAATTHTVTQCDSSFTTCPPSGGFDAGNLSPGQSFSQTFNTPGTFEYHCNFHPTMMMGRITVVAPQSATPTPAVGGGSSSPTPATTAAAGTTTPATAATATPARTAAAVPTTGGSPSDGGPSVLLMIALAGAALAAATGMSGFVLRRR